jgi:sphingomyelin phosphodiesterase acid-like 3
MRRISLTFVACLAAAALRAAEGSEFVFVSDMHVDLYYGTASGLWPCNTSAMAAAHPFGYPDCDAPPALIESAWGRIESVLGNATPRHIVVAGDWLRHKSNLLTDEQNAAAFRYITKLAAAAAQGGGSSSSVLPVPAVSTTYGNNDVVPDYYFPYRNTTRTPLFRNMSGTLLAEGVLTPAEHASFERGAFYARSVEGGRLRVIAVNSLLWDTSLAPAAPEGRDPCGQFAFLEAELAVARATGQSVWIVGHVPPTINSFDVYAHPSDNATTPAAHYWVPGYERRYWALVAEYSDVLRAQVFAHTHRFAFTADLFVGVPLFILGAVSPVYRNWPNFFHVSVDDATMAPTRMQQQLFNMTSFAWEAGAELGGAYNVSGVPMTVSTLNSIADQLVTNATAWTTYRQMSAGGIVADDCATPYCRSVGACFIRAAGTDAFFRCLAAVRAP